MGAKYRLKQGIRALTSFRHTPDLQMAARYLNMAQLTLFRSLPRTEQLHAINVLHSALEQKPTFDDMRAVDDLAVAALLHDCGKVLYPVRVWQKTLPVLVKKASPRLFRWMADQDPKNLMWRGFAVKANHPAWGTQLAGQTETSERALWLIAHHQDPAGQWESHDNAPLLHVLQAADDAN